MLNPTMQIRFSSVYRRSAELPDRIRGFAETTVELQCHSDEFMKLFQICMLRLWHDIKLNQLNEGIPFANQMLTHP